MATMTRGITILILLIGQICGHTIEHVVVVMLENRAFDHMCGYLKELNPEIEGLTGNEFNLLDPHDPNSKKIYVNDQAPYIDPNPGHGIPDTTDQVFGDHQQNDDLPFPPMSGFAWNAEAHEKGWGPKIMSCFSPKTVPVISTLAQEFALFDHWYSSVPGPTEINRMYVHSATSHGGGDNNYEKLIEGYPQRTFFDNLYDNNVTWSIYMEEVTTVWFLKQMRQAKYVNFYRPYLEFKYDVQSGKLPQYTFIEPRYLSLPGFPANDQHPSHDVSKGELFLKDIYETLRNSPIWEKTLLIVTYDEHGGFFDHVPTPLHGVPNPDGLTCPEYNFNFTRLGVRVPTIAISPWINKGVVEHEASGPTPTSHYDHTSILATLKKFFNLPSFLTKRDAWAGTFEHLFSERSTPRTDCPKTLPPPQQYKPEELLRDEHLQKPNDLQLGFVALASSLNGGTENGDSFSTEMEASTYIRGEVNKFLYNLRNKQ